MLQNVYNLDRSACYCNSSSITHTISCNFSAISAQFQLKSLLSLQLR